MQSVIVHESVILSVYNIASFPGPPLDLPLLSMSSMGGEEGLGTRLSITGIAATGDNKSEAFEFNQTFSINSELTVLHT